MPSSPAEFVMTVLTKYWYVILAVLIFYKPDKLYEGIATVARKLRLMKTVDTNGDDELDTQEILQLLLRLVERYPNPDKVERIKEIINLLIDEKADIALQSQMPAQTIVRNSTSK